MKYFIMKICENKYGILNLDIFIYSKQNCFSTRIFYSISSFLFLIYFTYFTIFLKFNNFLI